MKELFDALIDQLKVNQFLSAGTILGVLTYLGVMLRGVPIALKDWIWRKITCKLEVSNHDPFYSSVQIWLNSHPYASKSRTLVGATKDTNTFSSDQKDEILLTLAPGNHLVRHNKSWLWVNISRSGQNTTKIEGAYLQNTKPIETITFTMFGTGQQGIKKLVDDILASEKQFYDDRAHIFIQDNSHHWRKRSPIKDKKLNSVILPKDQLTDLIKDVRTFQNSSEWYREMGIPYNRGYLLHGPPGTGKTSTVIALSNYFNSNLYIINLSNPSLDDEYLSSLLLSMKKNSIILMEDCDSLFNGRKNKSKSLVTFSGFLNSLDGVNSKEGRILVMTTNHRHLLDEALIRPGRIDMEIEFDYATEEQVAEFATRFFPSITTSDIHLLLTNIKGKKISMASIQKHFMRYKDNLVLAVSNSSDIKEESYSPPEQEEETEDDVVLPGRATLRVARPIMYEMGDR